MIRGPVEKTKALVWAPAEVQANGDGTWTAIVHAHGTRFGPVTGYSRYDALSQATRLANKRRRDDG